MECLHGKLLQVYRVPISEGTGEGSLYACTMSPDGRLVAVGGYTGDDWDKAYSVYILDRQTGRILRRLTGSEDVVHYLRFNRDGTLLGASLGGNAGVIVWETSTWTVVGKDGHYRWDSEGLDFAQIAGAWYPATSDDGVGDRSDQRGRVRLYRVAHGLERITELDLGGGRNSAVQPHTECHSTPKERCLPWVTTSAGCWCFP